MPGWSRAALAFTLALLLAGPAASAAKKAVPLPPPPEAPAQRTIVLLRHGQYAPDPGADPAFGPGLTPLGQAQARLTGARLAGLPFRFDAVFASPMTRAQETAHIVAADLPGTKIETVPELAECTPPTPYIAPGTEGTAEEMAACAERLDHVFAEHFKPALGLPRYELLVCHGNVTRYLLTRSMHVDPQAWLGMSLGHTSLSTVRIFADGTIQVIAAGDVGHLPPSMHTGTRGDAERSLDLPKVIVLPK
jgi:serine/threonine-protein phosphatase PGAM5